MNEKDRRRKDLAGVHVIAEAVRVEDDGTKDSATVSSCDGSSDSDIDQEANESETVSVDNNSEMYSEEEVVAPSSLTLQENHTARQLDALMRAYVRSGYIEMLLGVLLNAPWLALIYLTQQDITYLGEAR
jgi:hypothetical protein